ncbi:hypothetical protein HZH66_014070 [Vespula vulgaris]|uniref:Uncharacterized protein n=1 Tax=Vespula vulgaris TaxID=7454 RepID=A0A834J9W7_VESVU|nr:hypothetical protein HZH66_014070 [Vespula vulgaris]
MTGRANSDTVSDLRCWFMCNIVFRTISHVILLIIVIIIILLYSVILFDSKVTNFPKEERRSKEEDERTNGSTKLRNIKKVEIALSLRIANVLRFMVLVR